MADKTRKRISSSVIALMMLISGVASQTTIASAKVKTPSTIKTISVSSTCSSQKVSWSTAKYISGYQLYVDNPGSSKDRYILFSSKTRSYKNTGISADSTVKYKVRGYKNYTKTEYYNSKTKKWQSKKPSKKYWKGKKKRKVTAKKYGKWTYKTTKTAKHSYTSVEYPATFTEDGYIKYSCRNCSYAYTKAGEEKIASRDVQVKAEQKFINDNSDYIIYVSWNEIKNNITGYEVERAANGGEFEHIAYIKNNDYADKNVSGNGTYSYRITPYINEDGVGISGKSSETSIRAYVLPDDMEYSVSKKELYVTLPHLDESVKQDCGEFVNLYVIEHVDGKRTSKYRISADNMEMVALPDIELDKTYEICFSEPGITDTLEPYCEQDNSGFSVEKVDSWTDRRKETIYMTSKMFNVESVSYQMIEAERKALGLITNLKKNDVTSTSVSFSWDKLDKATSYNIYRDGELISNITDTTYTDSGLNMATLYTYEVEGVRNEDASRREAINIQTESVTNPGSLKGVSNSVTSVSLSWGASLDAEGYKIYRNDNLIATVNDLCYEDKGLKNNTTYKYTVKAYNGDALSTGVSLNVTTLKIPTCNVFAYASEGKVIACWQNISGVDFVEVKIGNGSYKAVKGQEYYEFTGLKGNTEYRVYLRCVVGEERGDATSYEVKTPELSDQPFAVDKNTTLKYGNTQIYLGQKWSTSVDVALRAGMQDNETYKITRPNFVTSRINDATYDETVYYYGIGDYDNALVVHVANEQIIAWVTNGKILGVKNGKTVYAGQVYDGNKSDIYAVFKRTKSPVTASKIYESEVGAPEIAGFTTEYYISSIADDCINLEQEKMGGFHFINMYRHIRGRSALKYSEKLDGKDYMVDTTPIKDQLLTDKYKGKYVRFGAQAKAETITFGLPKLSHDMEDYTIGPVAGMSTRDFGIITAFAGNFEIGETGECITTWGWFAESAISSYNDSFMHLGIIESDFSEFVGIGMAKGGANCLLFGEYDNSINAENLRSKYGEPSIKKANTN